jgi:hypothetical protein
MGGIEMSGIEMIVAERKRQVEEENWTPEHDDEHTAADLSRAATSYVLHASQQTLVAVSGRKTDYRTSIPPLTFWPASWDEGEWNPSKDPIRNLVKAGALIAAEIDRLQRVADANRSEGGPHLCNFDRILFGGGMACTICDAVEGAGHSDSYAARCCCGQAMCPECGEGLNKVVPGGGSGRVP